MDSGSDTTFIRQDVAKTKLGLGESTIKLLVETYDGTTKEVDTYAVDFVLGKRDGRKQFAVRRAYALERLNISPNPPVNELPMDSWPHLAGLKFSVVTILVGIHVVGAHFDSKVRPPPLHLEGPAAFKTALKRLFANERLFASR